MESSSLKQYLEANYANSVFDHVLNAPSPWVYHLHGRQIIHARLVQNDVYDVLLSIDGQPAQAFQKTSIKLLYPVAHEETLVRLIKTDAKAQAAPLDPIISPKDRHHVKNKTLFPLMQQRVVLLITLLEGEIIKGLVQGFSRYDLTISLKGGVPVVVLRHAILDVRDKKGRCYLKTHLKKPIRRQQRRK